MTKKAPYRILPSLLAANPMALGTEIEALLPSGLVDMVHLDIMDNHYVPTLTFGPLVCKAIHQQFPHLKIDVHLMVTPVDALIEQFAEAGATRLSIHPEATAHLDRSLQLIHTLGCQAGLVLNPSSSLDALTWCRHHLDFVLLMTVNPGFGGQRLIPEVLPKINALREKYPDLLISVDGGIGTHNIADIIQRGAHECVVGSALFQTADYLKTLQLLYQHA